jgi:hypothetical protein
METQRPLYEEKTKKKRKKEKKNKEKKQGLENNTQ